MSKQDRQDMDWWLGLADVLAHGIGHGVEKLERVHLSIADESFNVLQQIPVTRPWSETVRVVHHGLSRVSYGGVAVAAHSLALLASACMDRGHSTPESAPKQGSQL